MKKINNNKLQKLINKTVVKIHYHIIKNDISDDKENYLIVKRELEKLYNTIIKLKSNV